VNGRLRRRYGRRLRRRYGRRLRRRHPRRLAPGNFGRLRSLGKGDLLPRHLGRDLAPGRGH